MDHVYPNYKSLDPNTTSLLDLTPSQSDAIIAIGDGSFGDYILDTSDLDFLADFDTILIGSEANPLVFDLGAAYFQGSLIFEGDASNGTLSAVGSGIDAAVEVGNFEAGAGDATFGMFIDANGKVAFEAQGSLFSNLPSDLELSASSVVLKLNETDVVMTGYTLSVNGGSYSFSDVPAGATSDFGSYQTDF